MCLENNIAHYNIYKEVAKFVQNLHRMGTFSDNFRDLSVGIGVFFLDEG